MNRSIVGGKPPAAVSAGARRHARVIARPAGVAAIGALLYLATPTADYFWDGITFALQIEKVAGGERSAALLFHQSHLLYNAAGFLLYWSLNAVGLHARALTLLQAANALLSAAALAVFFSAARRVTRDLYRAFTCTAALAVFATWWKLATDADAYIPAILLVLLCLRELLAARPRWFVAGLALAGAMLMHELAALFSFAAVALVFSSRGIRAKWRFAAGLLGLAWALSVAAYYACAAALHGMTTPSGVVAWATTNPSRITPSLDLLRGLRLSPRANFDLIVGHSFRLFFQEAGLRMWLIALAACVAIATLVWKLIAIWADRERRTDWSRLRSESGRRWLLVLAAWVIPYVAFLCCFEPEDANLRMFYAPALALVFGLACGRRGQHLIDDTGPALMGLATLRAGVLAVAALGLFNLAFFIAPHMGADASLLIKEARGAQTRWSERSLILYLDHNEIDTAFEYFNRQSRWQRLAQGQTDAIERIKADLMSGEDVWLNGGALDAIPPERLAGFARGDEIDVGLAYGSQRYVELRLRP